jgi:hypothetical protein
VTQPPDPHDVLAHAAPTLRQWRDERGAYESWERSSYYARLAVELVALARDGDIRVLTDVAPAIEQLLAEYDDGDAVSLGLIERFQELVEGSGLDAVRIYTVLGPRARSKWDDLYLYRHQGHYREMDFTPQHIEGWVAGPARVERWLAPNGMHLRAGQPIAQLRIQEEYFDLMTMFGCHAGRRAVEEGDELPTGSMLLHVLPDIDAHLRRDPPFARLVPAARGPIAPGTTPGVVV